MIVPFISMAEGCFLNSQRNIKNWISFTSEMWVSIVRWGGNLSIENFPVRKIFRNIFHEIFRFLKSSLNISFWHVLTWIMLMTQHSCRLQLVRGCYTYWHSTQLLWDKNTCNSQSHPSPRPQERRWRKKYQVMILRNGKFSGKILRNFLWKFFRTGKFSMENFPPHITSFQIKFYAKIISCTQTWYSTLDHPYNERDALNDSWVTTKFILKDWTIHTFHMSCVIVWQIDWLWWGNYVSERRSPTGLCLSPGLYVSTESHGNDDDAGWG
jgi:hypothetical protein